MATADKSQAPADLIATTCASKLVTKEEFAELMAKVEELIQAVNKLSESSPAKAPPRRANAAKGTGKTDNADPRSKVVNVRFFCRYVMMSGSDEEKETLAKFNEKYSEAIENDQKVQEAGDDEKKGAARGIALWGNADKSDQEEIRKIFATWKENFMNEGSETQLEG